MNSSQHRLWISANIAYIQQYINSYGTEAFLVATYYGAWNEGLWYYLYPYPGLKDSPLFPVLREAAVNYFI